MDAKTTTEIFSTLNELKTTIKIIGPTDDPRMVFDTKGLTENFKQALVDAGKQRLSNEIDKQFDKALGDKVPDEIKDKLKKPEELMIPEQAMRYSSLRFWAIQHFSNMVFVVFIINKNKTKSKDEGKTKFEIIIIFAIILSHFYRIYYI